MSDKNTELDKQIVMQCGFTEKESECWQLLTLAVNSFFALPSMHPTDQQEVANAIHIIQNKLLSRPAYRKYLDLHKKRQETTGD